MANSSSRILIIGATGYIGCHIAKASLTFGHPTFLLAEESMPSSSPEKAQLLESLKASGANILHGSVEDYGSVVEAIKNVDVVISALKGIQHIQQMSQMNIIKAIKQVGNIKRFLPLEFGFEYDQIYDTVEPATSIVENTVKFRKTIEAESIPYTYVITNCFAGYFVSSLRELDDIGLAPSSPLPARDKFIIYGDGNSKAVFVKEDDVATYTIKTLDDPRTLNKSLYFMLPANIMSVNELVGLLEKMNGETLEKVYVSDEELLKKIAEARSWDEKFYLACCHFIFLRGDITNFKIGPNGVEASQLYPDVKYITVKEFLSQCV